MDLELLIKTIIKQNNNANTFQLASAQDSVQTSKVMQSCVTFGAPDPTLPRVAKLARFFQETCLSKICPTEVVLTIFL
jgi:hypothetical protein